MRARSPCTPEALPAHGLTLGPTTRERAARVLEQQLGAVWAAVLESHGLDAGAGYRVVVGELRLEPGPPTTNGRAVPEEDHP